MVCDKIESIPTIGAVYSRHIPMEKNRCCHRTFMDRLFDRHPDGICCYAVWDQRNFILYCGIISAYGILWIGVWNCFAVSVSLSEKTVECVENGFCYSNAVFRSDFRDLCKPVFDEMGIENDIENAKRSIS